MPSGGGGGGSGEHSTDIDSLYDNIYKTSISYFNGALNNTALSPPVEKSNFSMTSNFLYFENYLVVDKNYINMFMGTNLSGSSSVLTTLNDKYWMGQATGSDYVAKTIYFYNNGVPIFGVRYIPYSTQSNQSHIRLLINPTVFNLTKILPKILTEKPSSEITSITLGNNFLLDTAGSAYSWNEITYNNVPTGYYYTTSPSGFECQYTIDGNGGIMLMLANVPENNFVTIQDSNNTPLFKIEGYTRNGSLNNSFLWFNKNFFDFSAVFPKFY